MSKEIIEYKPSEVYNLLKNIIESNDKIIERGGIPVAVSVEGMAGIGKSTIERELCEDMGRHFEKVSLAQYTQPEELVGFYQKESLMSKGEEGTWVTENLIPEYVKLGYNYTGQSRTKPCPPAWVVNLPGKSIICLDDYSRSNSLFNQAIMELN